MLLLCLFMNPVFGGRIGGFLNLEADFLAPIFDLVVEGRGVGVHRRLRILNK